MRTRSAKRGQQLVGLAQADAGDDGVPSCRARSAAVTGPSCPWPRRPPRRRCDSSMRARLNRPVTGSRCSCSSTAGVDHAGGGTRSADRVRPRTWPGRIPRVALKLAVVGAARPQVELGRRFAPGRATGPSAGRLELVGVARTRSCPARGRPEQVVEICRSRRYPDRPGWRARACLRARRRWRSVDESSRASQRRSDSRRAVSSRRSWRRVLRASNSRWSTAISCLGCCAQRDAAGAIDEQVGDHRVVDAGRPGRSATSRGHWRRAGA